MGNEFSQFPDYQTLKPGAKGQPGKANRSIPDRVETYGILEYVNKQSKVLDLGCNRGFFGTYLTPHIGSYVGIEGDRNQLLHAQPTSKMNLRFMDYKRIDQQFDVILCLAFHSYVGIPMKQFADDLDSMLSQDGTLFLEGHPPGYREEPGKHWEPLKSALLDLGFKVVLEKNVTDRELKRPFAILQR